jgi:tRNA(Arg) A34 adenosine deaminase TadA
MCAGAVYWGNVGRVVYALPESRLLQCTGGDEQNPTFDLPMREVLSRGQKRIEVIGPFLELEAEVLEAHRDYWNP